MESKASMIYRGVQSERSNAGSKSIWFVAAGAALSWEYLGKGGIGLNSSWS